MHCLFMTRGIKKDVDEVTKFLETRTLSLPFTDKEGNQGTGFVQGNLQPVQLWSYVFPENHKDEVLTALKFDKENIARWTTGKKSTRMRLMVEGLRLAMGGEKIPDFTENKSLAMPMDALKNVSIIPIGVKYDDTLEQVNGLTHESL